MDSLALLCNLYGDGPATLRRLRDAGCGDLGAVAATPAESLANLLRTSARSARRFQAESRILLSRVDSESGVQVAAPEAPAEHRDPLMRKVLAAWRERDAVEAPQAAEVGALVPAAPQPEPAAPADQLVPGCIESLDPGLCARLGRIGVTTLRELTERDGFEIAREAGLPFTRVARLQLLGRRALAALVANGALDSEEEPVEACEPPEVAADHEHGTLWPRPGPLVAPTDRDAPPSSPDEPRFSPAEQPCTAGEGEGGTEWTRLSAHGASQPLPGLRGPEAGPEEASEGAGPFA